MKRRRVRQRSPRAAAVAALCAVLAASLVEAGPSLTDARLVDDASALVEAAPPTSSARLVVDASAPVGGEIPRALWAAFIEDIGHSVTGGLHPELVSDSHTKGPAFVVSNASGAPPRVTLGATAPANAGRALRFCGGSLMATLDGSGDATFEWLSPGLTNAPGTASLRAVSMPNTGSVAGDFVVVADDAGTLREAPPDGSAAFNASATFAVTPLAGGAVALAATAPPAREGWLLAAGSLYASPCGWLGDTALVALVPPEGPPVPPPAPGAAVAWAVLPPRQPDGAAWALVDGAGGSFVPVRAGGADGGGPTPNTTSVLEVVAGAAGDGGAACNAGYYGINVPGAGAAFRLSLWARAGGDGIYARVTLESADRATVYAAFSSPTLAAGAWTRLAATLVAGARDGNGTARLCVGVGGGPPGGGGALRVTAVSLQPATAGPASGGARADLFGLLAAMRPAALRFPGGCFVEGLNASTAVNFTRAVGPPDTRPGHYNLWAYESHDFMGLLEYLELAESLGAQPVWVVNAGEFYGGGEDGDIDVWVAHALASLEYAMGDAASPNASYWARRRATDGHPAPFSIPFLAIGNENSGAGYAKRYAAISAAVRSAWPAVELIANVDVTGGGNATAANVDLVDLHVYAPSPDYFYTHQADLDAPSYRAPGRPRIFASEYAVKGGAGRGNLGAALAEAAYMIGLERNSDVVAVASYAPLLTHARDETWLPDAITFDATRAYGSPSYYAQALFATAAAPGDALVAYNSSSSDAVCGAPAALPLRPPFAAAAAALATSAVLSTAPAGGGGRVLTLKLVNSCAAPRALRVDLARVPAGWAAPPGASVPTRTLSSPELSDENDFAAPARVAPVDGAAAVDAAGDGVDLALPPFSLTVARVPLSPVV